MKKKIVIMAHFREQPPPQIVRKLSIISGLDS